MRNVADRYWASRGVPVALSGEDLGTTSTRSMGRPLRPLTVVCPVQGRTQAPRCAVPAAGWSGELFQDYGGFGRGDLAAHVDVLCY